MLINSPNISGSLRVTGNAVITGSLTVAGGINATITGSATTASYVEYSNVANKPALVSSSAQIVGYNIFATTGSNQFNGSQAITGSLTVTGQVVAQTLNVQQVTSSIVFSSGSNIFGNSLSNTQQFTGSVSVTGSLTVNGAGTFASSVTAIGGLISNGGAIGYGGGELGFNITTNGATSGIYTLATGSPIIYFDHRATSNTGSFVFRNGTGGANTLLTLSAAGAATFASSVTATSFEVGNGQFFKARRSSSNLLLDLLGIESGTDNTRLLITGDYNIKNGSLSTLFNMTTTGAATFSSSVTANGGMITTSANGFRDTDGTRNVGLYSNFTGGLAGIGTISNHDLGIFTNSSEKMRITAGGSIVQSNTPANSLVFDADHTSFTGRQAAFPGRFTIGPFINGYPEIGYNFYTSNAAYTKIANDTAWGIGFGVSNRMDFKYAGAGTGTFSWSNLMSITSGGNILIGTTGSGTLLNVGSAVGAAIQAFNIESNTTKTGTFLRNSSSNTNVIIDFVNGVAGGTVVAEIRANGGIANIQGNDVNLSDERTKKDILPLESYWDKFKAIEIVKFKYKDQTHDDYNIGVIAQQVEQVAPEFVDVDGWGNNTKGHEIISEEEPLKSIYTADLYHATIKVLQEAMVKIEEQQSQIEILKSKIEILEQS
jgi:hypothetical protein